MVKPTIKKDFKDAAKGGGTRMFLGHSEEAILRVVFSQNFVAINYVRVKINDTFGGDIGQGAVYTTLQRLEKAGYVQHKKTPPLPERGGKAQNVYSITASGLNALTEQARKNELIKSLSGNRPLGRRETATRAGPKA